MNNVLLVNRAVGGSHRIYPVCGASGKLYGNATLGSLACPEFRMSLEDYAKSMYDLIGQVGPGQQWVPIFEAGQDPEVEKLRQLVYMPGDWKCDKCGFEQHNRTLHASDGAVSAPRLEEVQTCPNDGEAMRRVTWKEGCESNYEAAIRFMKERDALVPDELLKASIAELRALAQKAGINSFGKSKEALVTEIRAKERAMTS